jgi:hypothetical protein
MDYKISVFCIWRDSEELAKRTLKQLENLEDLTGFSFSFYFYENDSKDDTPEILSQWIDARRGVFLSEKLNAKKFGSVTDPERMKLLCECRNKCKSLAGENQSDYSLLIDSDIEFDVENFVLQLKFLQDTPNAVMTTANVRQGIPDYTFHQAADSYYDAYAFKDSHGNDGMYFSDCPSFSRNDQFNWKIGKPIKCMSSFGGFAIIKSEIFNKVSWSADINCDHVNMCYDIGRYGDIYCIPQSKVYVNVGTDKINIEVCRERAKSQLNLYKKYF